MVEVLIGLLMGLAWQAQVAIVFAACFLLCFFALNNRAMSNLERFFAALVKILRGTQGKRTRRKRP